MTYLVWDFDGTLGYRSGGWSRACHDVLEDAGHGAGVGLQDIRPHLGEGFPWHAPDEPHVDITTPDEWWSRLYPVFVRAFEANSVPPERARELARDVRSTYLRDDWHVFEDAIPALSRLAAAGWTHVVLSNHVPEVASILGRLGLAEHLGEIYVSAEIGYEKPNPNAFRPVLDAVGRAAEDTGDEAATVWMIGDSYRSDVVGAAGVGIPAVLVRCSHPDADRCCEDLSAIDEVLADP